MAESGISLFSCARSTRHDEEDAKRFHKQILMALDGEVLTDSHGYKDEYHKVIQSITK